ncbi:MAG: hypothetical protein HFE80_07055 [Clostridiaceae bacterium]|jgi:hypothetical protein|nr:hypothetical protein [Clostridiaceae bacterium]
MLKKFVSTALTGLTLCSLLALPAMAHGHHGGGCHSGGSNRAAQPTTYALCQVEGCTVEGRHLHDGVYYCGACHEEGYCDGECPVASPETPSRYCGRHSSRRCW